MAESNGHPEQPGIGRDVAVATVQFAVPAVLTITMEADGRVNVNYPQNEMIARYLLDKARAILDDVFRAQGGPQRPSIIQPGMLGPLPPRRLK